MNRLDSIVNGPADQGVQPKITCADGFTLSVQASYGHYCSPRPPFTKSAHTAWRGPYTAVEVGYPSEQPEPWSDWLQLSEQFSGNPTHETVYGFVPVQMVRDLIALHGGER